MGDLVEPDSVVRRSVISTGCAGADPAQLTNPNENSSSMKTRKDAERCVMKSMMFTPCIIIFIGDYTWDNENLPVKTLNLS